MVVAMGRPNKVVVIVTGDPVPTVHARRGDYGDIIMDTIGDAWPGPWHTVDARCEQLEVDPNSALIITGSAASVHERREWMLRTEASLRSIVHSGVPVLGVCFGHQLLAQALGGDVQPSDIGREMSTIVVETVAADPLLDGLEGSFAANACHRDSVVRLPENTEVLARSNGDPHQCLRFSSRCYGVQFHPEFDAAVMRDMVEARRPQLDTEGLDADQLWERARNTPDAARIFQNFLVIATG